MCVYVFVCIYNYAGLNDSVQVADTILINATSFSISTYNCNIVNMLTPYCSTLLNLLILIEFN